MTGLFGKYKVMSSSFGHYIPTFGFYVMLIDGRFVRSRSVKAKGKMGDGV